MEPRETSGVTVHAIVRHVADRGGARAVDRVLKRAGRPEDADAFLDKRRWWSYDTKISLLESAAFVLGDEDVGLRVAEAVLHHSVGAAERLALSLTGGPGRVVLAKGALHAAELDLLTRRLARAFAEPVQLGDSAVPVRASIGSTLLTAGEHSEEVLHRADTAMYEAKRESAHRSLLAGVPGPRSSAV